MLAATQLSFVLSHDMYLLTSHEGNEPPDDPGGAIEIGFPLGAKQRWAVFASGFLSGCVGGNDADPVAFIAGGVSYRRYIGDLTRPAYPFVLFGIGAGVGATPVGFAQLGAGVAFNIRRSFGIEVGARYQPVVTFEPIHSIQGVVSIRFGRGPS